MEIFKSFSMNLDNYWMSFPFLASKVCGFYFFLLTSSQRLFDNLLYIQEYYYLLKLTVHFAVSQAIVAMAYVD